jgi:glycosyltransferase involved in cell wall biosynthesis
MESLISIVMPTLNRKHTIFRAVKSIIEQSYQDWELIIVDQGNDDYRFKDKRVRCYNHSEILSAAYARNKGIEYIQGDFVCFFDDDDIMLEGYLETMLAPFINNAVQASHCKVRLLKGGDRDSFAFHTPSTMIRRSICVASWESRIDHDGYYFYCILGEYKVQVVDIDLCLVQAGDSEVGGLRDGNY